MSCTHPNQTDYRYALGRRETSLCQSCADSMTALGMVLRPIERRAEDRPFRAPWLARLTARDETGRGAA